MQPVCARQRTAASKPTADPSVRFTTAILIAHPLLGVWYSPSPWQPANILSPASFDLVRIAAAGVFYRRCGIVFVRFRQRRAAPIRIRFVGHGIVDVGQAVR